MSRTTTLNTHSTIRYVLEEQHPREMYALLKAYYENNGLYDRLWEYLEPIEQEIFAMRPLRNPAHRAVEFYPANLWPGDLPDALPIEADNKAIIDPIQQVWAWSNWGVQKQVAIRWLARDGDWFTKVVLKAGADGQAQSVYKQLIEAQYVTDFDTDERGFLTYIRLDVPQERRDGDDIESYTYTEVWDKADLSWRVWKHDKGVDADLGGLGDADPSVNYAEEMGFDFIPFVHAKFRDIGDERGVGAFTHCIDKIDEANRICTRLHQMLWRHNRALWQLRANAVDKSGRPMPPPTIEKNDNSEVEMGGDKILRMPGNSGLESLVPNINYMAALNILNDHMSEIKKDLPELHYWELPSMDREMSGRAIRLLMSGAIARAEEARGNAVTADVRANQMALTIGQLNGLFPGLTGTYEAGDFEHSYNLGTILGIGNAERAEVVAGWRNAGVALSTAMEMAGATQQEIDEAQAALRQERLAQGDVGALLVDNFNRGVGNEREDLGAGTEEGEEA